MIKLISEKIVVKLGINELKVPFGTNICGFVNRQRPQCGACRNNR